VTQRGVELFELDLVSSFLTRRAAKLIDLYVLDSETSQSCKISLCLVYVLYFSHYKSTSEINKVRRYHRFYKSQTSHVFSP
jgi:hypothetical protein